MVDYEMGIGEFIGISIFGIVFLAAAPVATSIAVDSVETAEERMENAVEVDAHILHSDVYSEGTSDDRTYYADLRFEYTFEGERYESTNLKPTRDSTQHNSRSGAQSITRSYAEGETVTAYVDPNHPDEAFLEHASDLTFRTVGGYLLGAFFGMMGVFLLSVAGYFRLR